jgi:hypothetical protein
MIDEAIGHRQARQNPYTRDEPKIHRAGSNCLFCIENTFRTCNMQPNFQSWFVVMVEWCDLVLIDLRFFRLKH